MGLDIYLYSSVEFTPKDNKDVIVLWKLVKQIVEKTTLLNSFVNYLLGIKISDIQLFMKHLEHHNQCFNLLKLLFIKLKE